MEALKGRQDGSPVGLGSNPTLPSAAHGVRCAYIMFQTKIRHWHFRNQPSGSTVLFAACVILKSLKLNWHPIQAPGESHLRIPHQAFIYSTPFCTVINHHDVKSLATFMVSVLSTYSRSSFNNTAVDSRPRSNNTSEEPQTLSAPPAVARTTALISTLGTQLAASAARLNDAQKTLTRSQLVSAAERLLGQIQGDGYFANKAAHDTEVPKTNDPAILARAKQATAFVNDTAHGSHTGKNPFAGLSRDQLAAIVYDDSGIYTVNERRAASYEADRLEEVWREEVAAQAMEEYNRTGKLKNFFKSVLDHFNDLPSIEQVQYPEHYATELQLKIDQDFDYTSQQARNSNNNNIIDEPINIYTKNAWKIFRTAHT